MTDRERQYAALGFEYAEGIERAAFVVMPTTGRKVHKTKSGKWKAQLWNDDEWKEFADLLDALRYAAKPSEFSLALARLRTEAGMTLADLGDAAGLSRQRVHQLEAGTHRPRWDEVQALATALGVSTDTFRDPV